MSQEHPVAGNQVDGRRQLSVSVGKIKTSAAFNVIGLPELIGLVGAALIAFTVVFAYFYFYLPANSHLTSIQLERTSLQTQVSGAHTQVEENESTRDTVSRINASLEDFETNWLPAQSSGRLSLYTVLNNLIKSDGLRNTAGPNYSDLEVVGTKQQVQPGVTAEKQSTQKWQSIYPGIAVTVTVEGPYQNIRHFVRDVETSRQFLIINAIELEGVKQSGATADQSAAATPAAPPKNSKRGAGAPAPLPEIAGGRGGLVSLRMDLATYFQRPETKQPPTN